MSRRFHCSRYDLGVCVCVCVFVWYPDADTPTHSHVRILPHAVGDTVQVQAADGVMDWVRYKQHSFFLSFKEEYSTPLYSNYSLFHRRR